LEKHPRNHCLLRLLYASGMRVSEVCALTWQDLQERKEGGQVTVYGKGGKTRTILLSKGTWKELVAVRGVAGVKPCGGVSDLDTVLLNPEDSQHIKATYVHIWNTTRTRYCVFFFVRPL